MGMPGGGDPLLGTEFAGRFQIESCLGRGGMGAVYLARHLVLQRLFAVKVLRKGLVPDKQTDARFRREARAASRIDHPHIVSVFDFGRTEQNMPYLVMEYAEGHTLARVLEAQGPLPLRRALYILAQIADALVAAHAAEVVHRDLKPLNIVLTRHRDHDDFVKILDFGLAKLTGLTGSLNQVSVEGEVYGTPDYMAPEFCVGRPIDHRVDIYSFGVLAYKMLVGDVPFHGSLMQKVQAHLEHAPPVPSEVAGRPELAPEVDALILRCMAKQPGDRFESATQLERELRRLRRQLSDDEGLRPRTTIPEPADEEDERPTHVDDDRNLRRRPPTAPLAHATGPAPAPASGGDAWGDARPTAVWSTAAVLAFADEARRSRALDELACALRDRALGSPQISAVLAQKLQAEDRAADAEARIAQLERDVLETEFRARERESRLRQALSQLEHERRTAARRGPVGGESVSGGLRPAKTLLGGFSQGAAALEENALAVTQTIRQVGREMEQRVAQLNDELAPQRELLAAARDEAAGLRERLVALVRDVRAQLLDDELRALYAEAEIPLG